MTNSYPCRNCVAVGNKDCTIEYDRNRCKKCIEGNEDCDFSENEPDDLPTEDESDKYVFFCDIKHRFIDFDLDYVRLMATTIQMEDSPPPRI